MRPARSRMSLSNWEANRRSSSSATPSSTTAVAGALLANFYSSGQVCSNGTRVFVHRSIKTAFLDRLVKRVNAMRIGDPMNPETQVGALVSEQHMHKVLSYIARGAGGGGAASDGRHAGHGG